MDLETSCLTVYTWFIPIWSIPTSSISLCQFPLGQLLTLSIPTSSTLTKWELTKWDKVGIDELGIDKVGLIYTPKTVNMVCKPSVHSSYNTMGCETYFSISVCYLSSVYLGIHWQLHTSLSSGCHVILLQAGLLWVPYVGACSSLMVSTGR